MQVGQDVQAPGAAFRQGLDEVGHHEGHGASRVGGGKADVGILEGDAAFGRHAQPAGSLKIDVGIRLGALDVVARRHGLEPVEQAGLGEMVFGRGAPCGCGDGQRQAAAGQEIQQLDDTGFTGMPASSKWRSWAEKCLRNSVMLKPAP